MKNNPDPETYLSRTERGWTVIHRGLPMCHDLASLADCFAIGARFKLTLSARVWIGARGIWGTLSEAKSIAASA